MHVIMLFTVVTLLEDCQEIYMYISELFQFRVLSLSGSSVLSILKQKLCICEGTVITMLHFQT